MHGGMQLLQEPSSTIILTSEHREFEIDSLTIFFSKALSLL